MNRARPSPASLFDPLRQRDVTLRNRVGVSPMCTYSAEEGLAAPWHAAHLGARAIGGAGLVMTEATAVEPAGRITPNCLGLWSDAHVDALRPVTAAIRAGGAVPAIQLAHAGRKASTHRPWAEARGPVAEEDGGWTPVGPTADPFRPGDPSPRALSETDLEGVVNAFAAATERAQAAGFEVIEIHGAHGYLIHSFLSPLANRRDDGWGGDLAGRMRLALDVARAVRDAAGEATPVWMRLSAVDGPEDGWRIEDTVRLAVAAADAGVDLIDCSSGGAAPGARIEGGPGAQVPFAEAVRSQAGVASAAVGGITEPTQADAIVREGRADVVLLGRAMLRDPFWAIHAAQHLNRAAPWPDPYGWAVG